MEAIRSRGDFQELIGELDARPGGIKDPERK
jgi:hypothetical protein